MGCFGNSPHKMKKYMMGYVENVHFKDSMSRICVLEVQHY